MDGGAFTHALHGLSGLLEHSANCTLHLVGDLSHGTLFLTSFFIHKGSSESRDSDDEMKEALSRIKKRLEVTEEGTRRS